MLKTRLMTTALIVLALVTGACGSDESAEVTEAFDTITAELEGQAIPGDPTAVEEPADDAAMPEEPVAEESAAEEALGSGGVEPTAIQPTDLGRDIIFTADISVAVTDVATAGEEATRAIQGLGGFLFGQRTTGSPEPTSVLTFKVFPEDFQEALDRLGSIGEIRSQNVSADDVTGRIVDLESRINTAQASVDRLRGFLEGATTVEQIAQLENELLERETQLETLRGQLRTIENQVSLATIVLTITEAATRPAISLVTTAYSGHDGGISCPGSPELTVDQGTEATACFELSNVGDTRLREFTLRDPVLDVELDDLIVVFGDPAETLEPGQSIGVAAEVIAERSVRTQTSVTAVALDDEGAPLPGRPVSNTVTIFLGAADPGGIPSFTEGLEASWELLVRLAQLAVLVVGALIPFAWIPLVIWLFVRSMRSRRPDTPTPPPPPAPPAPERDPVGAGTTD